MTNYEYLLTLPLDKLADHFKKMGTLGHICEYCIYRVNGKCTALKKDMIDCDEMLLKWLESEQAPEVTKCPLCGHRAILSCDEVEVEGGPTFSVKCVYCGCNISGYSREDAVNQWNSRA